MPRSHRRPVEDFETIFRAISRQKEPVILVGGHAVNVWALSYQDRLGDLLRPFRPFTSGDMDVFATRNALLGLYEDLGGKLLLSGPREITDGTLVIGVEPDTREIDVLRRVNGLPNAEAQSAIPLDVCGHKVPVLFPHLLLKAKLENALHLDQRDRQDVKHVKIMTLVLREFLQEVVTTATPENEKYALELLHDVLGVLTSDNAHNFTRLHGLSFDAIMPADLLVSSQLRRLANFGRNQLPRAFIAHSTATKGPPASEALPAKSSASAQRTKKRA